MNATRLPYLPFGAQNLMTYGNVKAFSVIFTDYSHTNRTVSGELYN